MTDAYEIHALLIAREARYRETAHWRPVLVVGEIVRAAQWLTVRAARGTHERRNDWLFPIWESGKALFLIRDPKLAIEFKLTWGS